MFETSSEVFHDDVSKRVRKLFRSDIHLLAGLDDGQAQDGQVGVNDAAPDGLALALAGAARAVARVALGEQQADALVGEDALLHGEALLVVAARDAEHVALPLVAERVGLDLLAHPLLVEASDLLLVVDFEQLLGARWRVGDVELNSNQKRKRKTH